MIWAVALLPLLVLMDWALWAKIDGMLSFPSARWRWRRRRRLPWVAMWAWCVATIRFVAPSTQPEWQSGVIVGLGVAIWVWWGVAIYRDLQE
ncbi:hypothetical protein FHW96_002972 [Novosphingobium sp. SG751A]|uniref:hypothetical protein n=1 Tax=Novosphingobium sp. SG751A TaxID=2587000 RepID=UPI001557C7C1|nr:hypothetical protein [Novosphingobium sp. SG751A]NOW46808.1 hypothetical protein [Novosphingobium sp. SG751A]